MTINSIKIQNIRSIGEKISVSFEKSGLNILIGTNGGGKSNLMDIINIVLNNYFICHFREHREHPSKIQYIKENLNNISHLSRHDEFSDDVNQELEIELEFGGGDLDNIRILRENLQKISETEKILSGTANSNEIENIFKPLLEKTTGENLKQNPVQIFKFDDRSLNIGTAENSFEKFTAEQKVFFRYLNYFEKIKYLISKHNENKSDSDKIEELKYNVKFFSPYRFHEAQNFEVSLVGKNEPELHKNMKEKISDKVSSDVEYFTFHFSKLFNDLAIKNQSLIDSKDKCSAISFSDMEETKEVKKLLKIIGDYDFLIKPSNANDNKFKFIIKTEGRETEFNKLSSGEKEIFNFIFSIAALDLRNAVLIIDEPEIHLHPQWQAKLIHFYKMITGERNLQFIMATHSPNFVNSETVGNIIRVYKADRQTKLIPSEKTKKWKDDLGKQEDLIDIITFSNNAKLFFTDNVLLVEGTTDEIIFNFLINEFNDERKAIEVMAVNGKENFPKYISFLTKFKIRPIIIGDLDNLGDGRLLKSQDLIDPIRGEVNSKKHIDFESMRQYLDDKEIKGEITKRVVGTRILKIVKKLNGKENLNELDEKFLEHWLEKCVDVEKIIGEANIEEIYKSKDSTIKSIKDILDKLSQGVVIESEKCPVYILESGKIEDYYEEGGKNKKGKGIALEFLSSLKKYIKEKKDVKEEEKGLGQKNHKFDYLIDLTKKILSSC